MKAYMIRGWTKQVIIEKGIHVDINHININLWKINVQTYVAFNSKEDRININQINIYVEIQKHRSW